MTEQSQEPSDTVAPETLAAARISFAEFLQSSPPSQTKHVGNLVDAQRYSGGGIAYYLARPELRLHCGHSTCNGERYFRCTSNAISPNIDSHSIFLEYLCSNCRSTQKRFSLVLVVENKVEGTGTAYKYGEHPTFGVPTPTRMLRMFGDDRELFLKGRRCESQGLGIAAFSYYRRVVENHKNQILDEVLRVADRVNAPEEMIQSLRAAKAEIQFSKAMASARDAIPQSLLINGQNPLSLLHTALSIGLHEETDERCLELAHDIRVVLSELADRIGTALKDEQELNTAVTRLMNVKAQKPAKQ